MPHIRTPLLTLQNPCFNPDTSGFVDELFTTFAKFGDGQQMAPSSPSQSQQPIAALSVPTGPRNAYAQSPAGYGSSPFNRKRTFQEGFQADLTEGSFNNRMIKAPRLGRGGSRGDFTMGMSNSRGAGGSLHGLSSPSPNGLPVMPPTTFPPFNQNDPIMMAMQGLGFPQMPAMPPLPIPDGQPGEKITQRCPFYDMQGICYLGTACPYQHGEQAASGNDAGKRPLLLLLLLLLLLRWIVMSIISIMNADYGLFVCQNMIPKNRMW